ncbi:MAG: hypothetical protein RR384_08095 [Acidaminococcaceae bacterium]
MDINVNLKVTFEETPALVNCFGAFTTAVQTVVDALGAAAGSESTAKEPAKEPVQKKGSSRAVSKAKAVEPEPLPNLDDVTPERRGVTIEDARAKANELLKANPTNRYKVAIALKACGASTLTEITASEDLEKFVALLEAE